MNQPLFPANVPEGDPGLPSRRGLSDQETMERVKVLEELQELDDQISRLNLRRKGLVERLGQIRECN